MIEFLTDNKFVFLSGVSCTVSYKYSYISISTLADSERQTRHVFYGDFISCALKTKLF